MELTAITAMDSREIAERTGKEHAHVCRDIRAMLEELGEPESRFGSGYLDAQGQKRNCYLLPKRECLILASGYSVALRAKIIDRWAELEATNLAVPRTLSEALRFAADLQDKIEAQRHAVEFVDRFVESKATQPLRAVAKVLKVNERKFVDRMIEDRILYRLAGKLTPHADHMETGRFEVKEIVAPNGHATTQMRFTTKGVEWIAAKVTEWGMA
ncbi:phage regulatory protein/antirepressor Ant [bacterium]|nr:phage regulatory protein/antirepressor Ant [bacterium]